VRYYYLSGPMRGRKEFNFPTFLRVAGLLRKSGLRIVSPAEHDIDMGFHWEGTTGVIEEFVVPNYGLMNAIKWDVCTIADDDCAGVICLPEWEESSGARLEAQVALFAGKKVFGIREISNRSTGYEVFDLARAAEYVIEADRQEKLSDGSRVGGTNASPWVPNANGDLVNLQQWPAGIGPLKQTHRIEDLPSEAAKPRFGRKAAEERLRLMESLPDARSAMNRKSTDWAEVDRNRKPPVLSGEMRVTDPNTGGQKGTKLARFDLVPADVMWVLAEQYGRGARKYADRNWELGYNWSLSYAALQRHLNAFWRGEDYDSDPSVYEEGEDQTVLHLTAALWHACSLTAFFLRGAGTDDRPAVK
jgi:hypothetical protein